MRVAVHYRFDACECLGSGGTTVPIPQGIWPIAETNPVCALVRGEVLALDSAAFERLKREGKARLLASD